MANMASARVRQASTSLRDRNCMPGCEYVDGSRLASNMDSRASDDEFREFSWYRELGGYRIVAVVLEAVMDEYLQIPASCPYKLIKAPGRVLIRLTRPQQSGESTVD